MLHLLKIQFALKMHFFVVFYFEKMVNKYNFVDEITIEKDWWRILVRVIRMWMVSDVSSQKENPTPKLSFSMETVFADSKVLAKRYYICLVLLKHVYVFYSKNCV